ncbi:hypothetical protein [Nannocystis sp.]|uniref:hypothetical protein n=1 Tax=Nannocystis sp. TaxID=1962667 RepID=UPI0025DC1162|nr:hypothetical protein [Nannocystis sp.]MBK7828936.1 hypothetical protein [Nannocystis sp.]
MKVVPRETELLVPREIIIMPTKARLRGDAARLAGLQGEQEAVEDGSRSRGRVDEGEALPAEEAGRRRSSSAAGMSASAVLRKLMPRRPGCATP